jgi:NAD(P)-dependent dehydrogenase (short-subunit alcohol dehydrogenase family)
MEDLTPGDPFSLEGMVAVVTGATGVLGGEMARALARSGAAVALLGRREEKARSLATEILSHGAEALALPADVLDKAQLQEAKNALLTRWGRVDILLNAAGGNVPEATVGAAGVFDLPESALRQVVDLNFLGTVLPCQVFGAAMAAGTENPEGCIVNVSSMAATRPLTNVVGYSAAKAAVENFTRWLAVELARTHGPNLRVNAIAPGFFLGEQNREMLLNIDGTPTERGQSIIDHTPAHRFGNPQDLSSTLIYLCSPASRFVNGIVVPVDGGFSAFSGV